MLCVSLDRETITQSLMDEVESRIVSIVWRFYCQNDSMMWNES